jgi:glycosyltransferase involved in cell wall biosynthesis
MRLCLPIDLGAAEGGGFQFLRMFRDYLGRIGWEVGDDLARPCDVLFTNHWMVGREQILAAMRVSPDLRLVQRIDGAAADYGRAGDADGRQAAVNRLADLTVFQSAYCRFSTREKFPVIGRDGPIIPNPVDLTLFRPGAQPPGAVPRIACVTWSTNPMKGAARLYATARRHPEAVFVLCGRYDDAPDLPNIVRTGTLGREQLAAALRSCHLLLTYSRNEACPNHVIEALASGLPVLYDDSGAAGEVIGEAGLPVTEDGFTAALATVMADHGSWSRRARARAEAKFDPADIFARYVDAIEAAVAQPPHVPVPARLGLAWLDAGRTAGRRLAKSVRGRVGRWRRACL